MNYIYIHCALARTHLLQIKSSVSRRRSLKLLTLVRSLVDRRENAISKPPIWKWWNETVGRTENLCSNFNSSIFFRWNVCDADGNKKPEILPLSYPIAHIYLIDFNIANVLHYINICQYNLLESRHKWKR